MKPVATLLGASCGLGMMLAAAPTLGQTGDSGVPHYEVVFEARILPTKRIARATWTLGVGAKAVREMNLQIDPERHFDFRGDGELTVTGSEVVFMRSTKAVGKALVTPGVLS